MLPLISKRTGIRWDTFEVRQKVKTLTFKHAFLSCTLSQFPTCFLYVPKSISCLLTIYLFLVFLLGAADRKGNHVCAEFVSSAAIKWVTWSHNCTLFGVSSWKMQLFLFHLQSMEVTVSTHSCPLKHLFLFLWYKFSWVPSNPTTLWCQWGEQNTMVWFYLLRSPQISGCKNSLIWAGRRCFG